MATKGLTGVTNLYLYNRYVNDIDDDPTADINDTEKLRYIIDQTNDLIAQKCGRTFGSATYREWVEGEGTNCLVLGNYPITKVKLVSASSIDAFTVQATGFSVATVNSDGTNFTLNSIASDGTETETDLAYATYTSVTTLVAAINLVSGWTAEVISSQGSALTQLLRPVATKWCLDEKAYLRVPYLGNDGYVAYESDSTIRSTCGGVFTGDVFVWYTAGYTLPVCDGSGGTLSTAGNVPEALTMIANMIVKENYDLADEDGNMKSEKMGDYSYTRDGIMSAIDRHWKDLNQYARKVV